MTFSGFAPWLLVIFIIAMNIALWSFFKNKESNRFFDLWRKTGTFMQKPWDMEDKNLQELSARVQRLKQKSIEEDKENDDK